MHRLRIGGWTAALLVAAILCVAVVLPFGAADAVAQTADPFELLRTQGGAPVTVPPRALAVIPERHTGRLLRVTDELDRIVPQFDDLARGAGLSSLVAIQLRTREANIPIFVAKTDAAISTVLAIRLGAPIEFTGLLVERGNRYLFLASEVRPAAASASGGSRPR